MADFLPRPEAKMLSWAAQFSQGLNQSPQDYNVLPEQAADFEQRRLHCLAAYHAAMAYDTRGPARTAAKLDAFADLQHAARAIVRIIRACESLTDQQLIDLGLRPIKRRSPITPPTTAPLVTVDAPVGRTVRLRLRDSETLSRYGRPRAAASASVFYYVPPIEGPDDPPTDPAAWTWACNTTRSTETFTFPNHIPAGTRVWLMARWSSARARFGPIGRPVALHLGFAQTFQIGGISQAA